MERRSRQSWREKCMCWLISLMFCTCMFIHCRIWSILVSTFTALGQICSSSWIKGHTRQKKHLKMSLNIWCLYKSWTMNTLKYIHMYFIFTELSSIQKSKILLWTLLGHKPPLPCNREGEVESSTAFNCSATSRIKQDSFKKKNFVRFKFLRF